MKFVHALLILLLLSACAAANRDTGPGGFVAPDIAPDARERTAEPLPGAVLTSDEIAEAALLIDKLENTEEQSVRDQLLQQLVGLGPRYLPFYRRVDRDAVLLDMMYVIRRIETANGTQTAPPTPENTDRPAETSRTDGQDPRTPAGPNQAGEYDRAEVERYWASVLRDAQRMLEIGRFDAAARIAEAAIVLMPDTKWRPDFDAVLQRARNEGQAELILAGTMALNPGMLQYAAMEKGADFREPLLIHCYLKNVSASEITLRLNEGPGRESIVQLFVRYEQTDYQATALNLQGNVSLPVDAGANVTLAPGQSYELTVPLAGLSSLDSDAPLKQALGTAVIEASLRVYGAIDANGNPVVLRPIRFQRKSVIIFPADFDLDAAQARPLTFLRKAITDQQAQQLFLAAHVVDRTQLRNAGDILVAPDFEQSPIAMQRARLVCMRMLFSVGPTWDINQWRQWWTDNRLRDHAKLNR